MKIIRTPTAAILAAAFFLASQTRGGDIRPASGDFAQLEGARAAAVKEFFSKGKDAYPDLARYLSTIPCDSRCHLAVQIFLCSGGDGGDMLSEGDPVLLSLTREFLSRQLEQDTKSGTVSSAFIYLAQKGNGDDLALMQRYFEEPVVNANGWLLSEKVELNRQILQTRVSGTNIVRGMFDSKLYPEHDAMALRFYTTNWLALLPSVANTGPQAEYVYKALWKMLEQRQELLIHNTPYSVITNVAPELLTMRVWFDAGGKAVTDADLAKYGIEVAGLGFAGTNAPAAPAPQGPHQDAVPVDADAPPAAKASGSPPHSRFVAPLAAGAGLLAALLLWRGLRRRKP